MATKKETSNSDEAYKVQKFLKRLSIDFKFLKDNDVFVKKESNGISCYSKIDSFFKLEAKVKTESNLLIDSLNDNLLCLNFTDSDFAALKKCLKKEVIEIFTGGSDFIEYFDKEGNMKFWRYQTTSKYDERFEAITIGNIERPFVENIDGIEPNRTYLSVKKDGTTLIEVPIKYIYGYEKGPLKLSYGINKKDNRVLDCCLNYSEENIEYFLYFSSISFN